MIRKQRIVQGFFTLLCNPIRHPCIYMTEGPRFGAESLYETSLISPKTKNYGSNRPTGCPGGEPERPLSHRGRGGFRRRSRSFDPIAESFATQSEDDPDFCTPPGSHSRERLG